MGSYLTNSKMSPALRARIEASVRGRSAARKPGLPLFVKTVLRLSIVITVLGGGAWLYSSWRAHRSEVDAARTALLDEMRENASALGEADNGLRTNSQSWLLAASTKYDEDHVAPNLDAPALDALLSRPIVYVRGPIEAFQTTSGFERAMQDTVDDSFVHCLVASPAGSAEATLLQTIEAPRDVERIFRLAEAFTARPFVSEDWTSQVLEASTVGDVGRLRARMQQAQIERAIGAAHAEVLIHVLDEPRTAGTFAELDGASDHYIRVGIVDLVAEKTVLRLRRHVEPTWISEANRHYFARSLIVCRLAVDVRKAVVDGIAL